MTVEYPIPPTTLPKVVAPPPPPLQFPATIGSYATPHRPAPRLFIADGSDLPALLPDQPVVEWPNPWLILGAFIFGLPLWLFGLWAAVRLLEALGLFR